jgi:hypothetical protein
MIGTTRTPLARSARYSLPLSYEEPDQSRSTSVLLSPRRCVVGEAVVTWGEKYDDVGDNRASFRELDWKTSIVYGREVRETSNASHVTPVGQPRGPPAAGR